MTKGDTYDALKFQSDEGNVVLGQGSSVPKGITSGVAIGNGVTVSTSNVSRIGGNQLVFGGNDGGTIANTDLNNGEITVEFDEANTNFVIRGKDSGGTVQTATVTY